MKLIPIEERACRFNMFVTCDKFTDCQKCGWNPDVAKKRHEETMRKYNTKEKG